MRLRDIAHSRAGDKGRIVNCSLIAFEPNDYEFYFLGRIEGKTGHEFRATIREHDPLDVMKHFRSEGHWVIGPHGHSE